MKYLCLVYREEKAVDAMSKSEFDAFLGLELLEHNAHENGLLHLGIDDPRQGIVHVVGPELGITQPGLTITCGDSHTPTHGAFGTYAVPSGAGPLGLGAREGANRRR